MDLLGGIVWGTGMPGAGKTILACIVIEHLQKLVEESESKDICLLFAFCRYTERLMVIDILLALLRQLLERHPQVLPFVKPMYERHKRENTRPSEAEVVDLLRRIATSGLFKKTFYILDGLDEAASDIQVDLLEILSSLPVHFFITSRPLDTLKELVPDAHFLTIIASDPDIALLIDQKIHRMPALRRLLLKNATLKAEVVSMISSKSSGMFLLASLHLDMLKECASEHDVRKALDGLPQGLDGMYDATMARIKGLPEPQAELAKRVLIWVTYAQRPLMAEELVLAVSVCPETFRFNDKLEPAGIDSILSLCCGLVQVDSTTDWQDELVNLVRFVHYSVAEYMVKRFQLYYPDDPHALIASTCIAFLRHYGFHDVSSQGTYYDEELWDRFTFLGERRDSMASYPYEYWGLHAQKSILIPAPALEFLDDCKQYPSLYDDRLRTYELQLPSEYYRDSFSRLETLDSIHVAALYGIREYFIRLESEGWTNTARLRTYNLFNSRGSHGSTPLFLASMTGREYVVVFLMGVADVDVNLTDGCGRTALFAAVVNRHAGVVKAILSREGVDVNQGPTGWLRGSPLTRASHIGQHDIIQLLLEVEGIDVNGVNSEGKTALALAAQKGHHDIVKILLQTKAIDVRGALDEALDKGHSDIVETLLEGEEVSLDEEGSFNSLMRAARSGEPDIVTTVLNHGTFDINAMDDEGCSALAHSLHNCWLPTGAAEALLQIQGIDVNSVDKDGTTVLMLASRHQGDVSKLVETIIKLGSPFDINAKDRDGRTALADAAWTLGSREVVTMLLAVEGVDYNWGDARGQTPLMLAAERGRDDVVGVLLELDGIEVDPTDNEGKTALAHAVLHDWVKICEALLKVGSVSADYTTSEGLTYLMLAAGSGKATFIHQLLQVAQFDVNARDLHGRTALAHAVASRSYNAVEALLEVEGVDVHCIDGKGIGLLMGASRRGEMEMVNRFLGLGLGANINAGDSDGRTALAHATLSGSREVVMMLLGVGGVDYNCVDAKGQTPLMTAIVEGHSIIVDVLLALEGIKTDSRDNEGKTALVHAALSHQVGTFEALLKVDSISADYTTSEGWTFLMLAAKSGNATKVRAVLQQAQFDVNARDIRGRTALAHAVESESYAAVEALLEVEGVDVHCVDGQGRTLLMYASKNGTTEVVKRFLGLGFRANINVTDIEGRTALFYAAKRRCCPPDIVSALLKVEGVDYSVRDIKGRTPFMVAMKEGERRIVDLFRKAGG
ncbi:ankyrin [Coprinopsis marcescibilis]|uniref:Ankyrin n=1 Tax=Coprinopsis marcescibilis TaxID=230819 RepID=A0A5C3KC42_COPMA|nr:ankyrin [Coprinopsis marcescibilis]